MLRRSLLPAAAWLAVTAFTVFEARADSLIDQLGPREIAVGDSLRGDARGALSVTLNPSGLAGNNELVFEGSYGYRSEDGADAVSVSGCDSTAVLPGCFYYRYFTAEPEVGGQALSRRAHEGGMTLARAFTPRVFLGVNARYFDYESDLVGEQDESGFTFDIGGSVVLMDQLRVGVVGHHLFGTESPQYPRALGTGLMLRPVPALSLSFDAMWNLDREDGESTGRYGGGVEYFLQSADRQSGYPLRFGAVHDVFAESTYIGGGLGFVAAKMGIDVGVRRQVDNGDELVVQAGLRLFGPRQVPGTRNYR